MTPLKISLCLHYAISAADDPWIDSGAPIVGDTMRDLERDGLLIAYTEAPKYRPSEKCKAFVELLTRTPLPVPAFIDPRDGMRAGNLTIKNHG